MATVAIAIGVSLIGGFITSALTPKPKVQNQLDDLSVLKSEYGVPIFFVKGRQKVTGNIIWAPQIFFIKQRQGGKGGGGGQKVLKYYARFAALVCEGPIDKIGKVWFNNRLVFNDLSTDPQTQNAAANWINNDVITVYTGTQTQLPDPFIESFEGVGNVPGFIGRCYAVFRGIPLERYGNAVPRPEFEVLEKPDPQKVTLREVIESLVIKAKLTPSQYDITDAYFDLELSGYSFLQSSQNIRVPLEDLQKIYQFVIIDNGAKLIFRSIDNTTPITIDKYALGAVVDNSQVIPRGITVDDQKEDLPSEMQLEFDNVNNNYQRGIQIAEKATATHVKEINFKTKVAMTDSEAQTAVTRLIEYYWVQGQKYEGIKLHSDYYNLNAGDIIDVEINNGVRRIQIDKIVKSPDYILELQGFSTDDSIPNIVVPSPIDNNYNPNTINIVPDVGDPEVVALDTNLVRDTDGDIGLYASVDPDPLGTWLFGELFGALAGGSFFSIGNLLLPAAIGDLTVACPTGEPFVVDTVSVFRIQLEQGELENVPDDSFYSLSQILYIEGELIAFQNAAVVGADLYEISTLIRGVRGTESFISSHPIGAKAYLIKGGDQFDNNNTEPERIGVDLDLKAVPDDAFETEVTQVTELRPFENFRSYPYSPVDFMLTKNTTTNDLTLEWTRRTRKGGSWTPPVGTVPLAEDFEAYDIEIYDGVTLVRTITDNLTPDFTYTSALQVVDFGSNQDALDVRIYQKSVLTGRGYVLNTGLTTFTKTTS